MSEANVIIEFIRAQEEYRRAANRIMHAAEAIPGDMAGRYVRISTGQIYRVELCYGEPGGIKLNAIEIQVVDL